MNTLFKFHRKKREQPPRKIVDNKVTRNGGEKAETKDAKRDLFDSRLKRYAVAPNWVLSLAF